MFLSALGQPDNPVLDTWLRRFLTLHFFVGELAYVVGASQPGTGTLLAVGALGVATAAMWVPAKATMPDWLAPLGSFVAWVALTWVVGDTFPHTANHLYLEWVLAGAMVLTAPRSEADRVAFVAACRGLGSLVLVWSGVQKVLAGVYFRGEYFAIRLASGGVMAESLKVFASAEDVERLVSLGAPAVGKGPYRLTSWFGILSSNLVYIAEVGLGAVLWAARSRTGALLGALLLFALLGWVTREVYFATLMGIVLLSFLPNHPRAKYLLQVASVIVALADLSILLRRAGLLKVLIK